jgi:hypothetical protein
MSCGVDRRRCGGMRPTRGPLIDGDGDTLTIPEDRMGTGANDVEIIVVM